MTAPASGMRHRPIQSDPRKGRTEQVIEALAGGLGTTVGWLAESGALFLIFAIGWLAFAAELILSQGSLDQAWQSIQSLPLIVQVVVWVLFLPVMIGIWVWETTWPLILRLILVVGIAGWNLIVLRPRALQAARP